MMTERMFVPELTRTLVGDDVVLSPCLTRNRAGRHGPGETCFFEPSRSGVACSDLTNSAHGATLARSIYMKIRSTICGSV